MSEPKSTPEAEKKKGGIEARRTPRRMFNHPIGILFHGKYSVVQGLQLSEGGMLIQAKEKFVIGEILVITLVLPGKHSVVTRGEIIYERPGQQFGVRFTSLPVHQRRLIRSYVTAKTEAEASMEFMGKTADAKK